MSEPTIDDVIDRYRTLCAWADEWFERVHGALGQHMQCGKGCWTCCTMKSVSALEAHVIGEYLGDLLPEERPSETRGPADGRCPLLVDSTCGIYPVRPVICRTHGVPMRHGEDGNVGSCLMNFEKLDLAELDETLVLDEARVTANLIRLNAAFCTLAGVEMGGDDRVLFSDLLRHADNSGSTAAAPDGDPLL